MKTNFVSSDPGKCDGRDSDRQKTGKGPTSPFLMVAGPGFELTHLSTSKQLQELSTGKFDELRRLKSA